MPSSTNKLWLTFLDHRGEIAKVAICVLAAVVDPTSGTITAVRALINAVSGAANTKASIAIPAPISDTPGSSPPYENADKLALTFLDANNATHTFRIPAPIAAAFTSDNETADPAAVPVDNIVGTIIASTVTQGGAAFVSFKGGRRIRL